MKKLLVLLMLSLTFLCASIDLNTATKAQLMEIKGIGEKKAEKLMEYRKTNKITKVNALKKIKGFGPSLIENIKKAISSK